MSTRQDRADARTRPEPTRTEPTKPDPARAEPTRPDEISGTDTVAKTVTVGVPAERAFAFFTERPLDWWPADHILVPPPRLAIEFEPRAGGRWYERSADGTEADWGRVLAWEPPHRLALSWRIDGRWRPIPDDDRASEIVVTFTPRDADTTEVELAHVKLHRHGPDAALIRRALEGPSPGVTLAGFARAIAADRPPRHHTENQQGNQKGKRKGKEGP